MLRGEDKIVRRAIWSGARMKRGWNEIRGSGLEGGAKKGGTRYLDRRHGPYAIQHIPTKKRIPKRCEKNGVEDRLGREGGGVRWFSQISLNNRGKKSSNTTNNKGRQGGNSDDQIQEKKERGFGVPLV